MPSKRAWFQLPFGGNSQLVLMFRDGKRRPTGVAKGSNVMEAATG
jgi:hypothetical protein